MSAREPSKQTVALRAPLFNAQARSYLEQHPGAPVIALAEGLQTSFWRLDAALPNSQFRWLTVDLAPPPGRGLVFNSALSLIYRTRALHSLRACYTLREFG